jgi:glycolate oxidase iron-sulfur subunit
MQTSFSLAQLADPNTAEADRILRSCVHCGFCTATCPTYVLLGDELDSPRGRIYLIKEMLEQGAPATADVVKHIDRCLSCLACMTTCPSGVHYMHLVDHARAHIESTYRRPLPERLLRGMLAHVLPNNRMLRWAIAGAGLFRGLAPALARAGFGPLAALLRLAPGQLPHASKLSGGRIFPATGPRRGRVALLTGCVSPVLAPAITEATVRVLNRNGVEVVVAREDCCGSLALHMGGENDALRAARAQIDAWRRKSRPGGSTPFWPPPRGAGRR